jgi:preprotein translocase subunit YajC
VVELLLIVAVLALLWLFLIMPQRRRQAAQNRLMEELEVGDEIITVGGLFGEVRRIEDDEVHVELAPGTTVRLAKRAVAAVVESEEDPESEPSEEPEAADSNSESGKTPLP